MSISVSRAFVIHIPTFKARQKIIPMDRKREGSLLRARGKKLSVQTVEAIARTRATIANSREVIASARELVQETQAFHERIRARREPARTVTLTN